MFDELEDRIYHEVILPHQRSNDYIYTRCICGWQMTMGVDTYAQHLANKLAGWIEANFTIYDKI